MSDKNPDNPQRLRLAILFSGNASAIQHLRRSHPFWNYDYEIVIAISSDIHAVGMPFFQSQQIPCEHLDRDEFPWQRELYFQSIAEILQKHSPDLVICSGFKHKITDTFLRQFPRQVINIHPADLSIIDSQSNTPRYAGYGKKVTQKVIADKRVSTRSTIHFVEEGQGLDCGEIITHSQPYFLSIYETPETLLDKMKLLCDGQALEKALNFINGRQIY